MAKTDGLRMGSIIRSVLISESNGLARGVPNNLTLRLDEEDVEDPEKWPDLFLRKKEEVPERGVVASWRMSWVSSLDAATAGVDVTPGVEPAEAASPLDEVG